MSRVVYIVGHLFLEYNHSPSKFLFEEHVDAVLLDFLPGPLAGDAMADIFTGRVNPGAKLPIAYPKYEDGGGIPYLHAISDMCTKDTDGTLPN